MNQLPYQDLATGLPSHFHELVLLLRQLTGLASLTRSDKQGGSEQGELMPLLETIEVRINEAENKVQESCVYDCETELNFWA